MLLTEPEKYKDTMWTIKKDIIELKKKIEEENITF